jgi:hypothetical protein
MMLKNTQLNAKAAFIKEQIDDRISKGATVLEMQLLGEFKDNKEINLNLVDNIDVCAIHMPLINGVDSVIEHVDGREYFKKATKLASDIANLKGHNVIVVLHTSIQPNELKLLGIYDEVVNTIRDELEKYNNIEVAIENTATCDYRRDVVICASVGTISIENNGIKMANIELIKAVGHERCGSCFDICHAIMNENNLSYFNTCFEGVLDKACKGEPMFEIMLKQSLPTLKLIHLASATGNGFNELHGLPFNCENFDLLLYINNLLKIHDVNCCVTVEVYEDDINDAQNYLQTINTIQKL